MKRILLLLTLLLLLTQLGFAQTYTGCVIYGPSGNAIISEPIYTNLAGGGGSCNGYPVTYYSSATSANNLNSYCSIAPPLLTAQAIGGNKLYRNCSVNSKCGIIRTITVTECPIDGLEIILLTLSAGCGVVFISPTSKSRLLSFIRKLFGK